MPIYRIVAPSSVTHRAARDVIGGPAARGLPTTGTANKIPTINIHTTDGKLARGGATVSEDSVIDQEIRRQKERDAEITAERRLLGISSNTRSTASSSSSSRPVVSTSFSSSSRSNNNDNNNDGVDEERLNRMRQFNGDSFMFKEFEEQQRREEEIKRLRQRGNSGVEESVSLSISNTKSESRFSIDTDRQQQDAEEQKRGNSTVNGGAVSFSSPSESVSINGNAKANDEDYELRLSSILDADYAPVTGTGNKNDNNNDDLRESKTDRDGKERKKSSARSANRVQPYTDPDDDDYSKPAVIIPRDETLIEREVRVIRQREGSLRRVRGYPSESRDDRQKPVEVVPVNGGFGRRLQASQYSRSPIPAAWKKDSQPPPTVEEREEHEENDNEEDENGGDDAEDFSMKRLATNRLRMEILRERQREIDLRSQGKIHTISEERIGRPPLLAELIAADERKARNGNTAMTNGKSHAEAIPPKSKPGISVSEVKPKVERAEEIQIRGVLKPPKVKVDDVNVDDESRSMSNGRVVVAAASGTTAAAELPSTVTTSRGRLVGERLIEEEVQELKRREKELREQRRLAGIDDNSASQHVSHSSAKPVQSYRRF